MNLILHASRRPFLPALLMLTLLCVSCASPRRSAGDGDVFLFATFQNQDEKHLRFAASADGYHWTNVPGIFLTANVGAAKKFRDPSIVRGPDGTFHLVWTVAWRGDQGFGYASSRDLIHWSEQKFISVMTNEPATTNVWAPELFYDEPQKQFLIVWASTIPGRFPDHLERPDNNHRLYVTTTRDFQKFAPAKLFFDPGFSVIDGFILRDNGRYVLLNKDNSRPFLNLRVAFADAPLGPWREESELFTPKFTEGPCALKLGDDWLIYFEFYRQKAYGAVRTRDFKSFADVTSEVSFPPGHKHGTAFKVPREIVNGLLQAGQAGPQP